MTFIDDYSSFTRVYMLRNKDEAFDMFLSYKDEVKNQLDRKIKRIRSNRGGEYIPLNYYCGIEGIFQFQLLISSPSLISIFLVVGDTCVQETGRKPAFSENQWIMVNQLEISNYGCQYVKELNSLIF